jgi:CheY-like chemotaxis protein
MRKILIADDDKLTRRLLQTTLEKTGYEVVVVEDGVTAARMLSQVGGPRLALLDGMMPGVDGLGVIRAVRLRADTPYVHMILLTSQQSKEDIIVGLKSGGGRLSDQAIQIRRNCARACAPGTNPSPRRQLGKGAGRDAF